MLKNLADKELVQNKEDSYNIDKKIESLSEKNLENKNLTHKDLFDLKVLNSFYYLINFINYDLSKS